MLSVSFRVTVVIVCAGFLGMAAPGRGETPTKEPNVFTTGSLIPQKVNTKAAKKTTRVAKKEKKKPSEKSKPAKQSGSAESGRFTTPELLANQPR